MRTRKIRQISRIAKRLDNWFKSLEFKPNQKVEQHDIFDDLKQINRLLHRIEDAITVLNETKTSKVNEDGTVSVPETCELAEAVKKQLAHEPHPF
jgi:hypothetical protein